MEELWRNFMKNEDNGQKTNVKTRYENANILWEDLREEIYRAKDQAINLLALFCVVSALFIQKIELTGKMNPIILFVSIVFLILTCLELFRKCILLPSANIRRFDNLIDISSQESEYLENMCEKINESLKEMENTLSIMQKSRKRSIVWFSLSACALVIDIFLTH